jgi:hypothetical protein
MRELFGKFVQAAQRNGSSLSEESSEPSIYSILIDFYESRSPAFKVTRLDR